MIGLTIAVVVVLAVAVPSYFIVKSTLKAKPLVDAAKARFAQDVGYAYDGPQNVMAQEEGRRALAGGELVFRCEKRREGNAVVTTQSWWLSTPAPPRSSFRLVSRRLVGAAQAFANLVGPQAVKISRPYPGPHSLGDPRLDARFALYAEDPASARAVLLQEPVMRALDAFSTVVLDVGTDGVLFADPADANMWALYDASGLSRLAANPAPMIDIAARVHVAVHALLAETARAATQA